MPTIEIPRPRRLWLPGDPAPFAPAPRRHRANREPRTFRDWMRSPMHAMGRVFGPNGWIFTSNGGAFGATGTVPCCRYAVRKCSDNSLAGEYVQKSDFPSFPSTFYFKDGGGNCVYVQSTDTAACNATPLATIVTTYASCAACTGGVGCNFQDCSTFPSSLSVSGLDGFFNNCGGWTNDWCSYSQPPPAFEGVITMGGGSTSCGTAGQTCTPLGTPGGSTYDRAGWQIQHICPPPAGWSDTTRLVTASDGTCGTMTVCGISCNLVAGPSTYNWVLSVQGVFGCVVGCSTGSCTYAGTYYLTSGTGPQGTYTLQSETTCCSSGQLCPTTVTIS